MTVTLVAVIVVALFFDFTNGFHDTANSIATSVSTRAISPRNAVAMAAILNFVGAFISFKVAATIAKGIVDPDAITLKIILAGLVGAITWNLVTWYLGPAVELEPCADRRRHGLGDRRARVVRRAVVGPLEEGAEAVADLAVRRARRRVRPDDR